MSPQLEVPESDEETKNQHNKPSNPIPDKSERGTLKYNSLLNSSNTIKETPVFDLSGEDEGEVEFVRMGTSTAPSKSNGGNDDEEMLLANEASIDSAGREVNSLEFAPRATIASTRQKCRADSSLVEVRGRNQNSPGNDPEGERFFDSLDDVNYIGSKPVDHKSHIPHTAQNQNNAGLSPNTFKKRKAQSDSFEALEHAQHAKVPRIEPRHWKPRDALDLEMVKGSKPPAHKRFDK
jgi:hypothetical protein